MIVIVMPETCWAVSVRQSNKILRMIVASSCVFYLSDWRCTEPQTLSASNHLLIWIKWRELSHSLENYVF
jgi:hypothetical protein